MEASFFPLIDSISTQDWMCKLVFGDSFWRSVLVLQRHFDVIQVHIAPDKNPKTPGQLVLISSTFKISIHATSAPCDLSAWFTCNVQTSIWGEHVALRLQFRNSVPLETTRLATCCLLRSEWLSGPQRQGLIIYLHALLSGPKGLFVFGGVCYISISFVAHCCLNSLLTFWCFNGIVSVK